MLSAQLGYMFCKDDYDDETQEHLVYASCGIGARIYLTKKLGFTARFMTSTTTDYMAFFGLCVGIEF